MIMGLITSIILLILWVATLKLEKEECETNYKRLKLTGLIYFPMCFIFLFGVWLLK